MKKINNIKTEVQKKADLNKTGKKKIVFKKWENEVLAMMSSETNPTFSRIPGKRDSYILGVIL